MSASKDLTPSEKMRSALPASPQRTGFHPAVAFLAGLLFILLVLGCCVCGIGAWWFRPVFSEDPEKAREVAAEIVTISIPETFVPHGTIQWNLGFVMSLKGVYYERLVGEGLLTLLEVNTRIANDESVRKHIRQTLLEEGSNATPLVVDRTKTRKETFEIAGEPVIFTIDLARDPRTNMLYHIVEGAFRGKSNSGEILLTLKIDSTRWLDESPPLDLAPGISPENSLPLWLRTMLESIGKEQASPIPAAVPPAGSSGLINAPTPLPSAVPALAPLN